MAKDERVSLSRRERQVMDIIFALGSGSAEEVRGKMADPPSDSAVRSTLRILVGRGHLKHKQIGPRYVYMPTMAQRRAKRSALKHLLKTHFDDSAEGVMAALLEILGSKLSPDEVERIAIMIDEMKRGGR